MEKHLANIDAYKLVAVYHTPIITTHLLYYLMIVYIHLSCPCNLIYSSSIPMSYQIMKMNYSILMFEHNPSLVKKSLYSQLSISFPYNSPNYFIMIF